MSLVTLKYKRLLIEESVALVKDTVTLKKVWRHRYRLITVNSSAGSQTFKDYSFRRFSNITEFSDYIEDLPDIKRYKA